MDIASATFVSSSSQRLFSRDSDAAGYHTDDNAICDIAHHVKQLHHDLRIVIGEDCDTEMSVHTPRLVKHSGVLSSCPLIEEDRLASTP